MDGIFEYGDRSMCDTDLVIDFGDEDTTTTEEEEDD